MKLEFFRIKENVTSVPVQDKTTKEWITDGRILVNSDNITLKECKEKEREDICIFVNDMTGHSIFVLGSYETIKEILLIKNF